MRKIFFSLLVSTGFVFCGLAMAEDSYNLSVESISVIKADPADCPCKWQAVVKNNGANAVPANSAVSVQAYQGKNGAAWQPASGGSLPAIGLNSTKTAGNVSFVRLGDKNQIKVTLFYKGASIAEKIENFPAEQPVSLAIENCLLTDTGYTVTVRNLKSESISDLTVQGYTAAASSPQNWAPGGGMGVQCLKGGASYNHSGLRPAANQIIKIQIYSGSNVVVQQVFDLSPAPTATTGQTTTVDRNDSIRSPQGKTKRFEDKKR
jgi:hypothetical protein